MLEGDADIAEARQSLEQDLFEFRLIEGAQRRMAIEAVRELRRHQRPAARIDMADVRIAHEARRDLVEEPDLSEQAKGLCVIGDGARKPHQPGIAFEQDDPKAGQPVVPGAMPRSLAIRSGFSRDGRPTLLAGDAFGSLLQSRRRGSSRLRHRFSTHAAAGRAQDASLPPARAGQSLPIYTFWTVPEQAPGCR